MSVAPFPSTKFVALLPAYRLADRTHCPPQNPYAHKMASQWYLHSESILIPHEFAQSANAPSLARPTPRPWCWWHAKKWSTKPAGFSKVPVWPTIWPSNWRQMVLTRPYAFATTQSQNHLVPKPRLALENNLVCSRCEPIYESTHQRWHHLLIISILTSTSWLFRVATLVVATCNWAIGLIHSCNGHSSSRIKEYTVSLMVFSEANSW